MSRPEIARRLTPVPLPFQKPESIRDYAAIGGRVLITIVWFRLAIVYLNDSGN